MPLEAPNTPAVPSQPDPATIVTPQVQAPVPSADDSGDLSSMFSTAQAAGDAGAMPQTPATPGATASVGQPAAAPSYAQQAAQFGIELPATASDAEVFAAMSQRVQQLTPMAQYAQSLLPHADRINEFFAAQGQSAQPAAAPTAAVAPEWSVDGHFQKAWDGPKLTQEMQFAINQGMVVRDAETGLMIAKPGMELMVAPILQGLNHAINWRSEKAREFIEDPFRKTYDVLRDPIERMIDQRLSQFQQRQQQQIQAASAQQDAVGSVNQFEQANDSWMYQAANNGGKLLTPKGQAFVKLAREMSASYSGDPKMLLEVCKMAVGGGSSDGTVAPASQTTTTPAAPSAPATPTQASNERKGSFLQNALANAAHQPSSGANSVQSPTGPVAVTPMELESMFLSDFRATQAA